MRSRRTRNSSRRVCVIWDVAFRSGTWRVFGGFGFNELGREEKPTFGGEVEGDVMCQRAGRGAVLAGGEDTAS